MMLMKNVCGYMRLIYLIIVPIFATEFICVTRNAAPITMTSLFVTRCMVEAVSTTVVDTVIPIGPVIAFGKHRFSTYTLLLSDSW